MEVISSAKQLSQCLHIQCFQIRNLYEHGQQNVISYIVKLTHIIFIIVYSNRSERELTKHFTNATKKIATKLPSLKKYSREVMKRPRFYNFVNFHIQI